MSGRGKGGKGLGRDGHQIEIEPQNSKTILEAVRWLVPDATQEECDLLFGAYEDSYAWRIDEKARFVKPIVADQVEEVLSGMGWYNFEKFVQFVTYLKNSAPRETEKEEWQSEPSEDDDLDEDYIEIEEEDEEDEFEEEDMRITAEDDEFDDKMEDLPLSEIEWAREFRKTDNLYRYFVLFRLFYAY